MELARFSVAGIAQPQGNKSAFVVKGRAVLVEGRRGAAREAFKAWRGAVKWAAQQARATREPSAAPVHLHLEFTFARPKSHFTSKGAVKPSFREAAKTTRLDLDKLVRAIKDACTGVLWLDDSQVVSLVARKSYGLDPGVRIVALVACACGDAAPCEVHGSAA